MKYKKVGLTLGGGGAKGAYQIGVFRAMYEHQLVDDVDLISGTSIGAINSVLFATKDFQKAYDVWQSLNKDKVFTKKKLVQYLTNFKNISVFTRQGFLNLIDDHVDLEAISQSNIEIYALATPVKNEFAQTVFPLNGQTPEKIKDILLASSAIPGVFESVKINGVSYLDGYKVDNVPVDVAVAKGCDLVYVIPLGKSDNPTSDSYPYTTIINFKHPSFDDLSFNQGTLGFEPDLIKERMELGYHSANALITHLRKIGVLQVTKKEKFVGLIKSFVLKRKKLEQKMYYSLEDIGIYRLAEEKGKEPNHD